MNTYNITIKPLLLLAISSVLIHSTANAQSLDEQMQANLQKLKEQQQKAKPSGAKPIRATASSAFMVGKWQMAYTWIDANDNSVIDGNEKKLPPEITNYTTQYNADGTLGTAPVSGKRKGKYLVTNTWQWSPAKDGVGGHIVWIQALYGNYKNLTYITKYGGSTFVAEFDRNTTMKNG